MALRDSFAFLQRVGKSLMLPVAVLPVAGLLLGLGAANFTWMPPTVSELMRAAGDVIFGNMALIFAIAVALGFTDEDGVAAVAATIGYVVVLATMGVMGDVWGHEPAVFMGIKSMKTGVFGGILAGALAAWMFNRFHRISLPPYLAFFAGKRFVPIVTALAAIALGIVLSIVWPPIQSGINVFSHWAAVGDPRTAATVYGFVERLLVPFGLHHIWNAPFFYEIGTFTDAAGKVVHGDVQRYFAGDPAAGILGGAFLFKMFGLPAAAIAMWRSARPQHRDAVGGIMISAALTSALTGITEPIEFAFLFVAPVLYLLHATLAATAQFLMATLGAHMGFTFSQGGIDFVLFNVLNPHSQKWWLVLVLGPVYALIYFGVFRIAIHALDLQTPGRDEAPVFARPRLAAVASGPERGRTLVAAFGGRENLTRVDACVTRLRISVRIPSAVDASALRRLGATGVLMIGNAVQAVFGTISDTLKNEMQQVLGTSLTGPESGTTVAVPAAREDTRASPAPKAARGSSGASLGAGTLDDRARALLAALGGRPNIVRLEAVALTRLRVELSNPHALDEAAAKAAGVLAIIQPAPGLWHLIVGDNAEQLARALEAS